jgi:hypothetical protein
MNLGDKAKDVISAIAPTIGAAFGGPFGALAGKILAGLVGGDEKAVEKAVLSGDPDTLAKVRIAEIEFQKRIEELGIDRERLSNEDRNSARQREIAVRDHTPKIMALLVTLGFFGVLAFMLTQPVPEQGREALLVMLGALGSAWGAIMNYYFGSSAGSKDKTEALSAAIKR